LNKLFYPFIYGFIEKPANQVILLCQAVKFKYICAGDLMKANNRSVIFKSSLISLVLCLLAVSAIGEQAGPKAVAPTESHDFGTVLEGNDVLHDFVIQNKGDAPLDIKDVRTG
jgi:hypothetical protein